jgi:hypothetical protein
VAIVDDFEEIATERGKAPVIEDEQVDPRQHLEEPRIASVAAASDRATNSRGRARGRSTCLAVRGRRGDLRT